MSLGGFEYQSGSELQTFLKNPKYPPRASSPPAPIGLCFQLGTLECGSLLLQLPHKKHKKKLEKLDRIISSWEPLASKDIRSHSYLITFVPYFFGIVCLARRRCRSRSFRETGNMAVRRRACRDSQSAQGPWETPKMKSWGFVIGPKFQNSPFQL